MKIYFVEDLNIDLLCRSQMKNSSQLLSELSGRARTLKATAKIWRVTTYAEKLWNTKTDPPKIYGYSNKSVKQSVRFEMWKSGKEKRKND